MTDFGWWSQRGIHWRRRAMLERLGEGAEPWAELRPHNPVLVAAGPGVDEMSVRLDMAMTAIHEVASAAEGIDYAHWRMTSALQDAQAAFDASPGGPFRGEPLHGCWYSAHAGAWHACVEFANLVNWARTLAERVT